MKEKRTILSLPAGLILAAALILVFMSMESSGTQVFDEPVTLEEAFKDKENYYRLAYENAIESMDNRKKIEKLIKKLLVKPAE